MSNIESLYIIYLILVRLAVIGAGIISIHYGFKLFASGVYKIDASRSTTTMSGRIGDYEFKFKTAAPGAILAFFGASIIVISMLASPPEYKKGTTIVEEDQGNGQTVTTQVTERMRGDESTYVQLMKDAAGHKERGDVAKAINAYETLIRKFGPAMNDLAELYIDAQKYKAAKDLVEVAIMVQPSVPDYKITLERINNSIEENGK